MARKKKAEVIDLQSHQMQTNTMVAAIRNAIQSTIPFFNGRTGQGSSYGISPDGKRNYNKLFGYGSSLTFDDYYQMYKRGGIANVIVTKIARACWRDVPKLTVNDEPVLEQEMKLLQNMGMFRMLERADILNRIGKFSVLVVGIPDGNDLTEPLGSASNFDDVWFKPYTYGGTQITQWNRDKTDKRYMEPLIYQVQVQNYGDKEKDVDQQSRDVYFERVVHLAEGALDSNLEGTPALEPVYNALIDKDKSRGGSAEAFFINARQKFALKAKEGAAVDMSADAKSALKHDVQAFTNEWQTFMRLMNMDVEQFQATIASPRDTFDVAIEEIAGVTGIPVRILTGAGAGDMAGSNDKAAWNSLVADRQESFCTQTLLDTLKIFDQAGMINLPQNVVVEWPVAPAPNAKEQSEVTRNDAQALSALLSGLSTPAGDEIEIESVLQQFGFDDVKTDSTQPPRTEVE